MADDFLSRLDALENDPGGQQAPDDFMARLDALEAPAPTEDNTRRADGVPIGAGALPGAQPAPAQSANPLEDEGAFTRFMANANDQLANTLGLPAEGVKFALQAAGIQIMDGVEPTEAIKNAFGELGVRTGRTDDFVGQLGRTASDTALTSAALLAAAPAMAAKTGVGLKDFLMRDIGSFIQKSPGLFLAGEATSVPGQVAGGNLGGKIGETIGGEGGKVVGTAIGSGLGGAASSAIGTPILQRGLRVGPKGGKAVTEPLLPEGDPNNLINYSRDQIQGELDKVDNSISRIVQSFQNAPDPAAASVQFRDRIEKVYDASKKVETNLWETVPKFLTDPTELRGLAAKIAREGNTTASPEAVPTEYINRILQDSQPRAGANRAVKAVRSERLLATRSDILRAIRAEEALPAPNKSLIRNLERLDEGILNTLETSLPNNGRLKQARAYSYEMAERFRRGPIYEIRRQRLGGDLVSPEQTIAALKQKYGGGQVGPAINELNAGMPGGLPGTRIPSTADPAIRDEFDQGVRAIFAQELALADPDKAAKVTSDFITKNRRLVDEMGAAGTEIKMANEGFAAALNQKKVINDSALARVSGKSPDKAIGDIFRAPNPREAAAKLIKELNGDQDAIDGLRSGVVMRLVAQATGPDGAIVPQRLNKFLDPRFFSDANSVYQEILTPQQLNNLRKVASQAVQIKQGKVQGWVKTATVLSRILAASGGSSIAHVLGKGNIQIPSITSRLAGEFTEKQLKRMSAAELLTGAIVDPQFAALIAQRMPSTPKEMAQFAARLRAMTSAARGTIELLGEDE